MLSLNLLIHRIHLFMVQYEYCDTIKNEYYASHIKSEYYRTYNIIIIIINSSHMNENNLFNL